MAGEKKKEERKKERKKEGTKEEKSFRKRGVKVANEPSLRSYIDRQTNVLQLSLLFELATSTANMFCALY
jgi:hypothetical protein